MIILWDSCSRLGDRKIIDLSPSHWVQTSSAYIIICTNAISSLNCQLEWVRTILQLGSQQYAYHTTSRASTPQGPTYKPLVHRMIVSFGTVAVLSMIIRTYFLSGLQWVCTDWASGGEGASAIPHHPPLLPELLQVQRPGAGDVLPRGARLCRANLSPLCATCHTNRSPSDHQQVMYKANRLIVVTTWCGK